MPPSRRMWVTVQPKFFIVLRSPSCLFIISFCAGFNLLHVYEWQFASFAFAHEDGELV